MKHLYAFRHLDFRRLGFLFTMDSRTFDIGGAVGVSWREHSGPFSAYVFIGPFWLCVVVRAPQEPAAGQ